MSLIDLGPGVTLHAADEAGHRTATVDGTIVPYITVRVDAEWQGPNDVEVLLDDRMLFGIPRDRAAEAIRLLANAMAVAAGWTCFGPNRRRIDLFGEATKEFASRSDTWLPQLDASKRESVIAGVATAMAAARPRHGSRIVRSIARGVLVPRGPIFAPEKLCLWKPGPIVGDFGKNVWDEQAADAVMQEYLRRGNPVPIDVEHNTNTDANPGYDPSNPPRCGGYLELKLVPTPAGPELWLDPIRWSNYAREQIEGGERNAISPDWFFDKGSGRPVSLHKVSLVQNPGTHGIGLIASARRGAARTQGDGRMDYKMFLAALRAALTAEDPKAAIESLIAEVEKNMSPTEGDTLLDGELASGDLDEDKKLMASAIAALKAGRTPALPARASAPRTQTVDVEAITRAAAESARGAFREETAKASLIASARTSPAFTEELAGQLQSLPLANVKGIVRALPKAPVALGGGVKQGALAGAQRQEEPASAKEQASIELIEGAAKGRASLISEARASATTPEGKPKIGEDGSYAFSALAQMGGRAKTN